MNAVDMSAGQTVTLVLVYLDRRRVLCCDVIEATCALLAGPLWSGFLISNECHCAARGHKLSETFHKILHTCRLPASNKDLANLQYTQ